MYLPRDKYNFVSETSAWLCCPLMTPYGDIEQYRHCFSQWLVAWLFISRFLYHSPKDNNIGNSHENDRHNVFETPDLKSKPYLSVKHEPSIYKFCCDFSSHIVSPVIYTWFEKLLNTFYLPMSELLEPTQHNQILIEWYIRSCLNLWVATVQLMCK